MKAILLAAGMGTRLGAHTRDKPKCMVPFLGKPLLERQVETLRHCGITDITVVTGYLHEKIQLPGIKCVVNKDYATTNMVASLFVAESELHGDVLLAYTDILYEPHLIEAAQASKASIGVVVDDDYLEYWGSRLTDPMSDTESLVIGLGEKLVSLGISPCPPEEALARYVGIIRLSSDGTQTLKNVYKENRDQYQNDERPWFGSPSFSKGYMTSLLQAVIADGHDVEAIRVKRGWIEFDTVSDYELYTAWAREKTLSRFFNV